MVSPSFPSFPFIPIEPSFPLMVTAEPSLPVTPMEPSIPFSPFSPRFRLSLTLTLYGFSVVPVPVTVVFFPSANLVAFLAISSCSWLTFTASVPAVPAATLWIWLPPLSSPSPVKETGEVPGAGFFGVIVIPPAPIVVSFPSLSVTVMPLPCVTVWFPSASAVVTLFTFRSSFRTTFIVPFSTFVEIFLPSPVTSISFPRDLWTIFPSWSFNPNPFSVKSADCFVNWLTLTASVSSVPAATLVIFVPFALIPSLVTEGPPAMVTPWLLTVVSPAFTVSAFTFFDVILFSPVTSFANFTVSVLLVELATTPIFLSLKFLLSAPPKRDIAWSEPRWRTLTSDPEVVPMVELSPANRRGRVMV